MGRIGTSGYKVGHDDTHKMQANAAHAKYSSVPAGLWRDKRLGTHKASATVFVSTWSESGRYFSHLMCPFLAQIRTKSITTAKSPLCCNLPYAHGNA